MNELATWFRSWLDVDERMALAAKDPDNAWWWDSPESPAEAHIARWNPDRVLAKVEAERRVLDARDEAVRDAERNRNEPGFLAAVDAYDAVVRDLAQFHADRPGYREEWRP